MFLISSSRFRQATKDRIFFFIKPNQVIPTQHNAAGRETLDKRTKN